MLRVNKIDYCRLKQIIQSTYRKYKTYFQPQILPFTKLLAPGLSLAEKPNNKFTADESFGMNRCRIIANSLLAAWQSEKDSLGLRRQLLQQNLATQGPDWQRLCLNANSEDIYEWKDI